MASRAVGVCHSDIELLAGRYIIPFEFPVIPGPRVGGRGGAGRAGTSRRSGVGDRVVGECVIGQEHFGFSISGAAAEFFVAKEAWLHRLPDNLTWTQGALVEPFSCGYYATVRADNLDASDTVVVLGAGPIGLGVVAAAAGKGARVLVAEPLAARGDLARTLGAEDVLDPTAEGFLDQVADATGGAGRRPSSSRRAASRPPWRRRSRSPRFRARHRLHRHRRRRLRACAARPDPVQGAAGARHHRLARRLAADPAVPLPQRRGPHAAGDLDLRARRGRRGDLRPCWRTGPGQGPHHLVRRTLTRSHSCALPSCTARTTSASRTAPSPSPRAAKSSSRSSTTACAAPTPRSTPRAR